MKDIITAPFMKEMTLTITNMYAHGWDERNGGNVSLMLEQNEVSEYLDINNVIGNIPTRFEASELVGKYFLVTGTGKYFKNVQYDPENRVVIHCHPANLLAMTYVHDLNEKEFTRTLWQMCTECIVVFPDGVNVLPWMLCGTNEIGRATAEKMQTARLVVWAQLRTNILLVVRKFFYSLT